MSKTTKPKAHQWQRVNKNSLSQFMRSREKYLWVSTDVVNVPGVGVIKRSKGQTARRSKS